MYLTKRITSQTYIFCRVCTGSLFYQTIAINHFPLVSLSYKMKQYFSMH